VIDLTGIYNALVEQWSQHPNITQQQFVNGVESREIATADQANLYVQHFTQTAVDLMMLDVADWDSLQARVQSVGIDTAARAGTNIHAAVVKLADFRIDALQGQLAEQDAAIAENEAVTVDAVSGREEIFVRFPASDTRDRTVFVLNVGIQQMTGSRQRAQRQRQRLVDELAALGIEA
jgi:hypothetical protein